MATQAAERSVERYRAPRRDVAQAATWEQLPEDERRRRVTLACQLHDAETLLDLADSYLVLYGTAGAYVSRNTRQSYQIGIRQLLDAFTEENLLHPKPATANTWIRAMEERGYAPATIRARRAAGQCLYRALRWAKATDATPFADTRVARDPTPPWEKVQPYTDEEVERLLVHAAYQEEARSLRILVLLGADAGLRVSEMTALTWADVDLERQELLVRHGKGGKRATVLLTERLTRALTMVPPAERLGYVYPYRARSTAWKRLRTLCVLAGVKQRGVHSLRHTAGTWVYEEVGTLEDTAHHLRHSSIETTRVYAKWNNRRLKGALQKR